MHIDPRFLEDDEGIADASGFTHSYPKLVDGPFAFQLRAIDQFHEDHYVHNIRGLDA